MMIFIINNDIKYNNDDIININIIIILILLT